MSNPSESTSYMEQPIIGVLGGLGPAATVVFYDMVTRHTKAARDQDHINMAILSYATMPDRTAALAAGQHDELLAKHVAAINMLKQAGAQTFVMTCNTAHILADEIVEATGLPIINMITGAAEDCAARLGVAGNGAEAGGVKRRVAVLGTDGTVGSGIYQRALEAVGLEAYTPSPANQARVMDIIYKGVKAGIRLPDEVLDPIDHEIREAGCAAAILACTELSVFREERHLPDFYYDAMAGLARRVIDFAGKQYV